MWNGDGSNRCSRGGGAVRVGSPSRRSAANASSAASAGLSARHCRNPTERDLAADDALACIGLEAIDPRGLLRDALPDRQQEPGDEVDRAGRERWDGCELRAGAGLELHAIGLDPIMLGQLGQRQSAASYRSDQMDSWLDLAIACSTVLDVMQNAITLAAVISLIGIEPRSGTRPAPVNG